MRMKLVHLLLVSTIPVVKMFLLIFIGLFLALDRIHILGPTARKLLNQVVFFVFNPALVGSSLAKTITFKSLLTLWFMPVNILLTFILGSALGWILVKITRAPKHLKGLIIGACSAGNLGYMPIIIIPAICKETGSPFGAPDVCQTYGLSYASLSMSLGAIFIWVYVYNIVRISSKEFAERGIQLSESQDRGDNPDNGSINGVHDTTLNVNTELELPSREEQPPMPSSTVTSSSSKKNCLTNFLKKINIKKVLAPSTIGAIVGFVIGTVPILKKLFIGNNAPLHVIEDTASVLGDAAIPTVVLILGANLLQGLKGSGVQYGVIIGILVVRYILLPSLGIVIVKGAVRFGLVKFDPLFQFVLLLQYALPPAMNIGTMTQLFGAGQSECSVILMWTYGVASISLTFWCTLFLWLLASSSSSSNSN